MLLEKGKAAGFVDEGRDSGEVVRLVKQLRDAITRYQVSEDHDPSRRILLTPQDRFQNGKRSITKS